MAIFACTTLHESLTLVYAGAASKHFDAISYGCLEVSTYDPKDAISY